MKKLSLVIALAGVLAVPALQAGMTVTVTQGSLLGGNNGGQFTAATSFNGTFQTFCIERNEYFTYGGTYNVALNSAAVAGGVGGGSPDPLSMGTAWLYSKFITTSGFVNNSADTTALQAAIWMLENEVTASDVGIYDLTNPYFVAASGQFSNPFADASGLFGVRVMNLTDANGNPAQDLLVVPEPSTVIAGALLLLPFAASTIRRFRKNS